jgi:glycosyltransferase involved in cell wall biosynthesis
MIVDLATMPESGRFSYTYAFVKPGVDVLSDLIRNAGRTVICLGDSDHEWDFRWAMRLRRLIRDGDFDIIHTHAASVDVFVRIMSRTVRNHPRVVYTAHAQWNASRLPTRFINRLTLPLVDQLIAVSGPVARSYPRKFANNIRIIPPGFCRDRLLLLDDEIANQVGIIKRNTDFLVGTAARLVPLKNLPVLIEAIGRMLKDGVNVGCIIAGEGPQRLELRSLIESHNIKEKVHLLGSVEMIGTVLRQIDVFVLPSLHEGAPVSIMEAMAQGVPIVASDIEGIQQLVSNGEEGILVRVNDVNSLVSALTMLASDSSLRRRMGARARTRSYSFAIENTRSAVEDVYESILQESR